MHILVSIPHAFLSFPGAGLISYGASCGPFLFPFFGTLGILCYIDVQSGGKVIFRLSSKVPITKSLLSTITKSIMT